jgi:hypothetical protein
VQAIRNASHDPPSRCDNPLALSAVLDSKRTSGRSVNDVLISSLMADSAVIARVLAQHRPSFPTAEQLKGYA